MNTKTIIEILQKELDDVRSGKSDHKRAKAVAELSAQAVYAMRLDLEEQRASIARDRLDLNKFSGGENAK